MTKDCKCSPKCIKCCKQFSKKELPLLLMLIFVFEAIGFFLLYFDFRTSLGSLTVAHEIGYYFVFADCALLLFFSVGALCFIDIKKKPTLILHFIRLGIFFTFIVGIISTGLFFHPSTRGDVQNYLRKYYKANNHSIPPILDSWQRSLKCCGLDGVVDYHSASHAGSANKTFDLPDSCCKLETVGCGKKLTFDESLNSSKINQNGCFGEIPKEVPESEIDGLYINLPLDLRDKVNLKFGWSVLLWIGAVFLIIIFEVYNYIEHKPKPPPQPIVYIPPPVSEQKSQSPKYSDRIFSNSSSQYPMSPKGDELPTSSSLVMK